MLPFKTQLHVINLEKRADRRERFEKEFAEEEVNYRVWPGIIADKPATGINRAHKSIVRFAKEQGLPFIIIAEDDLMWSSKGSWKYFLSKLPDHTEYDLFFSMVYNAEIKDGRIINGLSGLTMYSVSSQFYDFFLSIPDYVHIDRHLGQFSFEKRYLIIDKYVCLQTGGFSDNLRRPMHYDSYLSDAVFFGQEGKVFSNHKWVEKV